MLALIGNPTSLVNSFGYVAIFVLCVAQSCCIPTSSELTMGVAGALAATGHLSLPVVIAVGTGGEVVGAYVAWFIGRTAGRAAVDRFGKYLLLTQHDLDRAEAWYDRRGGWGILGGRLVPVIRNFVALPAGVAEVPLIRFGVLTLVGSLIWDGAMAGIGYGVGSRWHVIIHAFSDAGYLFGALAVIGLVLVAVHRWRAYGLASAASRSGAGGNSGGESDLGVPSAGGQGGEVALGELANPREELIALARRLARLDAEPGGRDGAAANERLTAAAAAVLFVLLFLEGLTVLRINRLLSLHVVLGLILVPPVLVKLGSTGWRFVRYYTGHPDFVHKGPPKPLLRVLAPVLVLSTVVLFASGIGLVVVHHPYGWLTDVHRYGFVLWFAVLAVHVGYYMWQVPWLLRRDLSPRRAYRLTSPRGRRLRPWLTVCSVVAGVALALFLWPSVAKRDHTFFQHRRPPQVAIAVGASRSPLTSPRSASARVAGSSR